MVLVHERELIELGTRLVVTARAHSCAAWVVWRDGDRLGIFDSVGSIG
jgi:hypothetical protein